MLARPPTPTGFEFDPYGMSLNLACDHLALLNGTISECARCGETTVREEKKHACVGNKCVRGDTCVWGDNCA